jgi:hypothetical protein
MSNVWNVGTCEHKIKYGKLSSIFKFICKYIYKGLNFNSFNSHHNRERTIPSRELLRNLAINMFLPLNLIEAPRRKQLKAIL